MTKNHNGSSETKSKKMGFRERLGKAHDDSIRQWNLTTQRSNDKRTPLFRLILVDIVLVFLILLLTLALMVFIQTVGVATLDVSMSAAGNKMPPVSDIIFTSAVVGGLCGAVVGWTPRIFLWARKTIRNKVTSGADN